MVLENSFRRLDRKSDYSKTFRISAQRSLKFGKYINQKVMKNPLIDCYTEIMMRIIIMI